MDVLFSPDFVSSFCQKTPVVGPLASHYRLRLFWRLVGIRTWRGRLQSFVRFRPCKVPVPAPFVMFGCAIQCCFQAFRLDFVSCLIRTNRTPGPPPSCQSPTGQSTGQPSGFTQAHHTPLSFFWPAPARRDPQRRSLSRACCFPNINNIEVKHPFC